MPRALTYAAVLLVSLSCALGLRGTAAAEFPAAREYELKAAFIYNFAKFIEWPPDSFPDAASPLIIGVLGASPMKDSLDSAVAGRKVSGHAIVIKTFRSPQDIEGAHVLFIAANQDGRLHDLRETFTNVGLLTVGESDAFAALGGVIRFFFDGNKLRFAIDLESAERADLKISSQLLTLATVVHTKPADTAPTR